MPAENFAGDIRLEFIEAPLIEQAGEHLSHVVRHAMVVRQQLVQVGDIAPWPGPRRFGSWRSRRKPGQIFADREDAGRVVFRAVMGDRAQRRVRDRAAERFGIRRLSGGAFHEVGTTQSHERSAFHHEDHIGKGGKVRPARHAGAHHGADLRHVQVASHDRVVVEDAGGSVLPRKHPTLVRKVHPG